MTLRPLYLSGASLWTPGFASLDAFVTGTADAALEEPSCAWVPSRLMRGGSRLTKMLCEVAAQACEAGLADKSAVQTIYASQYGEIETMVILLDTIFAGDGQLSPMRFKNSVHNAASGLASIGTSNRAFSTALAAAERCAEACFLEAFALSAERGGDVVLSIADDAIPEPLRGRSPRACLGTGALLTSERSERALAVIDELRRDEGVATHPGRFADRPLSEGLLDNPAAALLPLLDAARTQRETRVPLAYGVEGYFSVRVRPL